jgi:hypothetical protein
VQRVLALARKRTGEAEAAPDVEQAVQRVRGGGQALDSKVRSQMEPTFGADFSGVRIHADTRADTLNRQLNARAFTTGQDIFFRQGAYNPGASSGRELLAHELTHVVQQNGDGVQRKLTLGQPDDIYEQEADQVAQAVMQREQQVAQRQANERLLCRQPEEEKEEESVRVQRQAEEEEEEKPVQMKTEHSLVQRQVEGEEKEEEREPIQAKTECSWVQRQVKEPEEEEAIQTKALADKTIRLIQRQVDEEEAEAVKTKRLSQKRDQVGIGIETQLSPFKGRGNPLPDKVSSFMEPRFGFDFDGVRIHNDAEAADSAKRIGAAAYTSGKDIYFGAGKYQPHTIEGKELIAHELVHVVQQTKSSIKKPQNMGEANNHYEREAKQVAHDVIRMSENSRKNKNVSSISSYNHSSVQLAGTVAAVNVTPAEIAAGRGRRAGARATAGRGININWSIEGNARGAIIRGRGRTATITAPAGSTGGDITIRAADAANPATNREDATLTLVGIQTPTFVFNPAMPGAAPANTMDASVCDNTATANAVTVPGGRAVQWGIRGNRRGAAIDRLTGVINPSATRTGAITVRARDVALRHAFAEQVLTIRAHPTRIIRTVNSGALGVPYGALYTHTFRSSGGSLNNILVGERIDVGNDPFNTGYAGVATGALSAQVNAAGEWSDEIGTPAGIAGIDVNRFLPSPPNPGLPQTFNTPQILYWQSDQCGGQWIPFANVVITATLLRRGGNFRFVTRDNRVPHDDPYGGAAFAGAAAAAPACPAGVSVSRVSLIPPVLAADGNPATTSAATARVRPAGTALQWSFPGLNFGAAFVNPAPGAENPAVIRTGDVTGRITVRAAVVGNLGCFAEGRLRLQQVQIGPIRFSPRSIRPGAGNTARARVRIRPGRRDVNWTIEGPALGCVITQNPDNSANIVRGAQRGRITVRATDQRDATKITDASLVLR